MYIDCASCPGRRRACDGCMMNLLFSAPNSDDVPVVGGYDVHHDVMAAEREIVSAVEVFAAASMVSNDGARSAKLGITAVQGPAHPPILRILRAG